MIDIVLLPIVGKRYEPNLAAHSLIFPSQMVPDVGLRRNTCNSGILPARVGVPHLPLKWTPGLRQLVNP
jgi:hypothetical protein